jgi:hypothetical protein
MPDQLGNLPLGKEDIRLSSLPYTVFSKYTWVEGTEPPVWMLTHQHEFAPLRSVNMFFGVKEKAGVKKT